MLLSGDSILFGAAGWFNWRHWFRHMFQTIVQFNLQSARNVGVAFNK